MPYEYAVYFKLLLLCGYKDELQAYLDEALAEQDPLSDIVLELSTIGNDDNKMLSVLNEYLLQVKDTDIDYDKSVSGLVLSFLNRRYVEDSLSMAAITELMYQIAVCSERYFDEPRQTMYFMGDLFAEAQAGYVDKEDYKRKFDAFLYGLDDSVESGDCSMKISEIEAKIERGDCSGEMLTLFKTALKRVPEGNRCQHCYITAAKMPSHYHKQAISLIQYGLTQHCNSWSDRMRSYHNMAIIIEDTEDYVGAKEAYGKALSAVDPSIRSAYEPEYAAHMMRMEMHIREFQYTEDLEKYYKTAIQADAFSQSFQKYRFYRLLAEILIFREHKDHLAAQKACHEANEMLRPGFIGLLTQLLKRKGIQESVGATKKARVFLRRMK